MKDKEENLKRYIIEPEKYEKAHSSWVHLISGITGGIALYFLSSHINFVDPQDIFNKAGLVDLALFIVAILGYTGYIPRILWFFANKGVLGIGKPS